MREYIVFLNMLYLNKIFKQIEFTYNLFTNLKKIPKNPKFFQNFEKTLD